MEYALYAIAALGLGAGAFFVARSPEFWVDFGKHLIKTLIPILMKRKSPEEEAVDRQNYRENKDTKRPGSGGRNS